MKLWPLFNRAADAERGQREWLKAALSAAQRRAYETLERELQARERAKARALAAERQKQIAEERRRVMARKPDLGLRMLPPEPVRAARAWFIARQTVRARQAAEMQALREDARQSLDGFLRSAEREREEAAQARAVSADKAKEPQLSATFDAALRARAAAKQRERYRDEGRDR